MTERWPPIPKRLMARMFANHERRRGASTVPYRVTRTAVDAARVTDVKTGASTEWQIRRSVTGVRLLCVEDVGSGKTSTCLDEAPNS